MHLEDLEFKRKFSLSMHKNLKIKLGEMSFSKDFINDKFSDLYPLEEKSEKCEEYVERNRYIVKSGHLTRLVCQFFPYASYEVSADVSGGVVGFVFRIPGAESVVMVGKDCITYKSDDICEKKECALPGNVLTMVVSCRPGAFDIFIKNDAFVEHICTFNEKKFEDSDLYSNFSDGYVFLNVDGNVVVDSVVSYVDNGISIADMRPVRYENLDVMMENGKIYLTASIRMIEEKFQGVFSWIPGTAEIEMTGVLFYDSGDGRWCGDVAASVLYNRKVGKWYLWVCSFAHSHVLAHSEFEGDLRFGVNVIDVTLMERADSNAPIGEFKGFWGDEDPDFFYDEERGKWLMAVCRINPETRGYAYVFFESDNPFDGYEYIGKGPDGSETGGSFVKIDNELMFICGNDFRKVSNYRIYTSGKMREASFNYPDGGFRGWGTVIPVKLGTRTRYFWLTFDRYRASDYNWSYGNLYCFEAMI